MSLVGLVAILQMSLSVADQGPLLAGLLVYTVIIFVNVSRKSYHLFLLTC